VDTEIKTVCKSCGAPIRYAHYRDNLTYLCVSCRKKTYRAWQDDYYWRNRKIIISKAKGRYITKKNGGIKW
jgi:hypothetical protein